jgi:hypothetical protein
VEARSATRAVTSPTRLSSAVARDPLSSASPRASWLITTEARDVRGEDSPIAAVSWPLPNVATTAGSIVIIRAA